MGDNALVSKEFLYDLLDRQVEVLQNGIHNPGYHAISWDASKYFSGLYIIRMMPGEYIQTQKLMLIKLNINC